MTGSFVIGGVSRIGRLVVAGMALTGAGLAVGAEEDFVKYLNEEATRVEVPAPQVPAEEVKPVLETGEDRKAAREAFESDMARQNRGTWMFYRKLPRRYRDEVFEDHLRGATIDELRAKIIRRYLSEH